jgi:hypothetical protein
MPLMAVSLHLQSLQLPFATERVGLEAGGLCIFFRRPKCAV